MKPAGVGVPAPPEPPGRGAVWRPEAKPPSWVGAWLRPDVRICLLCTRVGGAFSGVFLRRPLFFLLLLLLVLRQRAAGPPLLPGLAAGTGLQDAVDAEGRRWGQERRWGSAASPELHHGALSLTAGVAAEGRRQPGRREGWGRGGEKEEGSGRRREGMELDGAKGLRAWGEVQEERERKGREESLKGGSRKEAGREGFGIIIIG